MDTNNYGVDGYQEVVGKRENFYLHFLVAVLFFLVFGWVPPLVNGFSFPESEGRDHKLGAVAMASLVCIALLALLTARDHASSFKTILLLCWSWVCGAECFLLSRRLDPQTDAQVWMVPIEHWTHHFTTFCDGYNESHI